MSPSELTFHNATDEEIHGALIAFMTSPDARKALQLVPSSDIKRFMFLVMTPSVVEAYLAFEHSIINQPPQNDEEVTEQRREKDRVLTEAKEAEEAAALAADQLETYAAVAVMELNTQFPHSGYAFMIEDDMGGTGVWNDGVGIRCWSIDKEDKPHLPRLRGRDGAAGFHSHRLQQGARRGLQHQHPFQVVGRPARQGPHHARDPAHQQDSVLGELT